MRFYEFKDFAYYALIGAKDDLEAMVFYTGMVADIEEGDGKPLEIEPEKALAMLFNVCKDIKELKEAREEFEGYYKGDEPYLVLIDKCLL